MKIIIPTKEEAKKIEWKGYYNHFNERLNERYGIDITFDEYVELRKNKLQFIREEISNVVGIMVIKDVEVLVVKQKKKEKRLITALPYNNIYNNKKMKKQFDAL